MFVRYPAARWLSALCVAAQLVTACHFALVTHTRCAHGDMVHADEHGHTVDSSADGGRGLDGALALLSAADAGHDEGHDHCVAAHDRRKAARLTTLAVDGSSVVELGTIAYATTTQRGGRALFRNAPKTSPPAV